MDAELERLIASIHQSNISCVLVTTGGGATAAGWLLAVPGASRTILEILTPYSFDSLCQFLGKRPDGFCTSQTAIDMAEAAWARARVLRAGELCVGVACTASLATDRPKRGEHRFYAAAAVEDKIRLVSLTFEKDARTRAEEESIVSRVVLNLLAESARVDGGLTLALRPGEVLQYETFARGTVLAPFLRRELPKICALTDGRVSTDAPPPAVLMPGSFNPLHEGHRELLKLATEELKLPGAFELSVTNVDKPPLGLAEIRRRLEQFHGRQPVWLTHAPTFVEKSKLFPGCVFVIGYDTASRLIMPQYYRSASGGMEGAIGELRERGSRFLVAARANADGALLGLEDLEIPECFQGLLNGIPKRAFTIQSRRRNYANGPTKASLEGKRSIPGSRNEILTMEDKSAINKLEAILSLARSDLGSRRKSPWRWIITGVILFGLIAGFAWWVDSPRQHAPPLLIMAADAIALPEEAISLLARIENAKDSADGGGLAGTPIVCQESGEDSQQTIRCDAMGLASFTAAFRKSELPISWFARFAGDANRKPVQARGIVFVRPPTTSWLVIDADHALPALAEGDFWNREGNDVPLMTGALAALRDLKAKREICYVASSADTVNRHWRLKAWLARGWSPAVQQPPDGPFLSRATSELGPAEFLQSTVADLQKRFTSPVTALAARPEEAQAFLAAGVRTFLLGDAEGAPKGAIVVKSWSDGLAAKVNGSAR